MNKVFLSGFAIKDFEFRQVNGNNGPFNTVKGSINVRRERAKKDPNTGFYPSDLIDLEASGGTADILAGVQKGDKVTIIGSYRTDPYTGRDNQQPVNNQNVGNMAPTPAPQRTASQEAFNTPAGMPAGQGTPSAMPDFGALDGMPNFPNMPFS